MIACDNIRIMEKRDKSSVLKMMTDFYSTPENRAGGTPEIFIRNFDECIKGGSHIAGFVFEAFDKSLLGYALIAQSYSTEYGRYVIWVEEVHVTEKARESEIIDSFLSYLEEHYSRHIHRLDVAAQNEFAMRFYMRRGFKLIPNVGMIRRPSK